MVRVIYGVNNTLLTLKGIITVYTQTQRSYRRNQGSSQLAYSSLLVLPADSSLCVPGDLPYSQRSMPNQTPAQDPSASIFLYGKPQLMTNGEVYPPWSRAGWYLPARHLLRLQVAPVRPCHSIQQYCAEFSKFFHCSKGANIIVHWKVQDEVTQLWGFDFLYNFSALARYSSFILSSPFKRQGLCNASELDNNCYLCSGCLPNSFIFLSSLPYHSSAIKSWWSSTLN